MNFTLILEIIKAGATIFTDERRRKFESGLYERLANIDALKMKRFPFFRNSKLALAEKDLDNYLFSYAKELRENIEMKKAVSNV